MKPLRSLFAQPDTAPAYQSAAHRFWTEFLTACLALYLTYATYLSRSALFVSAADTVASLLWAGVLFGAVYAALRRWTVAGGARAARAERAKLNPWVFAVGTLVPLCVLGAFLLAADPGGVTVDSAVQWTQALTGRYTNWHPVFHTLLLRLCALIKPDYTFAVAVQCAAFSVALGYLMATLHAWGAAALPLVLAEGLAVASPIVGNTLMYLWKDNAMTIGALVLTAQAVNVYRSRGAWLLKFGNAVTFGLALAFTTLVRHNGLLFTLPMLLTVLLTCRAGRKGAMIATAAMVTALSLTLGPLYAALPIAYPSNGLEESIGVPMTVVSNIRKVNPDALDAETRAFTDAMADDAGWSAYRPDTYNTIKFGATRGLIAHTTLPKILRMAASAAKADPRNAFLAVNGVTDLVWGLADEGAANVRVRNSASLPSVPAGSGRANAAGTAVKAFLTAPLGLLPFAWYFDNLGVPLMAMLIAALRALRRNGVRVLLLCLPTLLYSLGTMCVLCGPDARFFSFSPLVCLFSLWALARDVPQVNPRGEKETA